VDETPSFTPCIIDRAPPSFSRLKWLLSTTTLEQSIFPAAAASIGNISADRMAVSAAPPGSRIVEGGFEGLQTGRSSYLCRTSVRWKDCQEPNHCTLLVKGKDARNEGRRGNVVDAMKSCWSLDASAVV
jgi:hypothetical protein